MKLVRQHLSASKAGHFHLVNVDRGRACNYLLLANELSLQKTSHWRHPQSQLFTQEQRFSSCLYTVYIKSPFLRFLISYLMYHSDPKTGKWGYAVKKPSPSHYQVVQLPSTRVGSRPGRAGFEALPDSIPISSGSKDLMPEPDPTPTRDLDRDPILTRAIHETGQVV